MYIPVVQHPLDFNHVAGTNKLEDVDIYAFDPPAPADKGILHNVAVNSTDAVLQSLLRTDVDQDRWIAGWENHRENLPEDPSQARLAASAITSAMCTAALCNIVQRTCHAAKSCLDTSITYWCQGTRLCI